MKQIVHELGKLSRRKPMLAVLVLFTLRVLTLPAQTLTTIHQFHGADGYHVLGGLIQAIDGSFYGITSQGGDINGYGTAFKVTPSGILTTLYDFCEYCTNAWSPQPGLVQTSNGDVYGVSFWGGPTTSVRFSKSLRTMSRRYYTVSIKRTAHIRTRGCSKLQIRISAVLH
jgi:uncharacterized repeat protein (TIGR03803 family)